jgi:hypothetical protein
LQALSSIEESRSMTDLKSKKRIVAKGVMFFVIALTTAALILIEMPSVKLAVLLALLVRASSEARLSPAARPVRSQTIDQFIGRMKGLRAEGKLASFQETPLGCIRSLASIAAWTRCSIYGEPAGLRRRASKPV